MINVGSNKVIYVCVASVEEMAAPVRRKRGSSMVRDEKACGAARRKRGIAGGSSYVANEKACTFVHDAASKDGVGIDDGRRVVRGKEHDGRKKIIMFMR